MATKVTTGLITDNAITDAKIANVAITGVTASGGDSSTALATTAFVAGEINSLIDAAPGALNTLNELAAAMGDDANFSTTVTNSIATKAPISTTVTLADTQTISGAKNFTNTGLQLPGHMFFNEYSAGRHYIHFKSPEATNQIDWRIQTNNSNNTIHSWYNDKVLFRTPMELTGNITIDSAASAGLVLDRANTTSGSTIDFKTAGTLKWYMGLRGLSNDNFYIRNEIGSTDALTIDGTGKIGIGTTSPGSTLTVSHESHGIGIDYVGSSLPNIAGIFTSSSALSEAAYGDLNIKARTDYGNTYSIGFFTASSNSAPIRRMSINSGGHLIPGDNNTYNLGSSANRWANIYTNDLNLSNEGTGGNDVDKSEGNWTIQEGETDLFIINNKNGKKYKFSLEELK